MIIKLDYTNIKNLCFSKTPLREYIGHSNVSLDSFSMKNLLPHLLGVLAARQLLTAHSGIV